MRTYAHKEALATRPGHAHLGLKPSTNNLWLLRQCFSKQWMIARMMRIYYNKDVKSSFATLFGWL